MAYLGSDLGRRASIDSMNFVHGDATSQVEIAVSCQNLRNKDLLSKSDPMAVLYERGVSGHWKQVGRTELIKDNLNPKFVKSFHLPFYFEELQKIRLEVYDVDSKNLDNLKEHDFLGAAEFSLGEICASHGQSETKELKVPAAPGKNHGYVTLHVEEVQEVRSKARFRFAGKGLDKKDLFGKSDPYLEILRCREDGTFQPVWRTKELRRTLDPEWPSFEIPCQQLNNGDFQRPLRLVCWDWDRDGSHDLIGQVDVSLHDLLDMASSGNNTLDLINPKKKEKKGSKYRNSGVLVVHECVTISEASFLDYIRGGCEINLEIAIDFTASNGNPSRPNSLHYVNPFAGGQPNQYLQAIQAVADILCQYDSDQLIPVYGFGGKPMPGGPVNHCFPLTLNEQAPEVHGLGGIIDAYKRGISSIALSGPTLFGHVLRAAMERASGGVTQAQQKYHILLIITDGVINDMRQTIDQIVEASDLPLSVVIVGVGQADFADMEQLDADETPLVHSKTGAQMRRDIVQFVAFREIMRSSNPDMQRALLTKETLAEIPGQLLSFMKSKGIVPNPPLPMPMYPPAGAPPAAAGGPYVQPSAPPPAY